MSGAVFPRISFEKMLNMPHGAIIDAIPSTEYDNYHLRGASVGSLAINLASGVNRINIRNDLVMHLTDRGNPVAYIHAHMYARKIAEKGLPQHFSPAERAVLSRIVGREVAYAPGIVLGIQPEVVVLRRNASGEPIVRDQIPFSAIDPYSQRALSDLFGVNVGALPLTPGAQGPEFPRPRFFPPLGGG